jgi:hypothetical protein
MRGRKKFIIVGMVVTVIAAISIAGVALADTGTTTTITKTNPQTVLMVKVATILGIDQAKVEAAFTQAQKEIQGEALDTYLKNQVAAGTITQAQADQYKTWIQAKPDVPLADFGVGGPGNHRGPGFGGNLPPATSPTTGSSTTTK